jgi:hypothetical protein
MKSISDIEAIVLNKSIGDVDCELEEFEYQVATQLVERGLLQHDETIRPCEEDDDYEYVMNSYRINTLGRTALMCYNALKIGAIEL